MGRLVSLPPGDRLGPYEIVAPLGAGGMGEVYRARDTRLGRDVAIKILAADLSLAPERVARFAHEARAAAALNHPNITVLYDVGSYAPAGTGASAETPYIVTELLEGATLRDRLSPGALPVRKALDYARQVALGLAAAHEKGIVHRDLKPENIFITSDDHAKILDFGLAKLTESEPVLAGATMMPTTPRATVPGTVMGTAGYMAPEQVRGLAADYRADLFAFGAVLYEMLTGQRAFRGDTPMDVMMAVVREEPQPLTAIRPDLPATLARIVERCLEKDLSLRFQSTRDLAFALAGQATQSGAASALSVPAGVQRDETRVPRSHWLWLLGGLLLGGTAAGVVAAFRPVPARLPSQPVTLTLPSATPVFRLPGVSAARPWFWSPSPDSRWLLGIDLLPDGRTQFVVTELTTGAIRGIESTAGGLNVVNSAWSPDSKEVAYWDSTDGFLKRLAIDTAAITRLKQFRDVRSVAWGPQGIVLYNLAADANGPTLQMVSPNGGDVRLLGARLRWPVLLPGGEVLAESSDEPRGLVLVNPQTGERRMLAPDLVPMGFVDGYVLYNLRERLVAHRVDVAAGALVETPIALGEAASQRVFASDTLLSWVTTGTTETTAPLVWIDREGRRVPVPREVRGSGGTTLAMHDDTVVAIGRIGPGSNGADVWTIRLDTGATTRVAATPAWEDHARWSRDGRRLLFRSSESLQLADVGSAAPAKTVFQPIPGFERLEDWSPDERYALVSAVTAERRYDVLSVDLQDGGPPVAIAATPATESFARFSPDGSMVAYVSDGSGPPEVYVQSFRGAVSSQRVSPSGGTLPKWSADGSRLYFLSPDAWIMEAQVTRQRGEISVGAAVRVVPASGQDFLPSSDGRRFLLMEAAKPRSLALVNWRSLLPGK
jgi:serine/threonine protein kinase